MSESNENVNADGIEEKMQNNEAYHANDDTPPLDAEVVGSNRHSEGHISNNPSNPNENTLNNVSPSTYDETNVNDHPDLNKDMTKGDFRNSAEDATSGSPDDTSGGNTVWAWTKKIGYGIYMMAYYAGEFLADLFGITRPRFEWALNEYYEREKQRALAERMAAGEVDENGNEIVSGEQDIQL